ncbi:MAG: type II toxin-antitoxin system HicB family antitoxin [Proteobacteria bacterium]|nr:type II toxin-antitoxin system HicB family antitoxin [Pseudomonadota bacterium]
MRYVYPVKLEQDKNGLYVATVRDVPEALIDAETVGEALLEMGEALGVALAGYSKEGRDLPRPSVAKRHEFLVPVAPLVAAKLALRSAMREKAITNVALAQLLNVSEGVVRRLIDPDHASRLDGIVAALVAIGHGLIIEDQKMQCGA